MGRLRHLILELNTHHAPDMTSDSTRKESNKKASRKYYKKYVSLFKHFTIKILLPSRNKDLENQKARERMRQLRSKRYSFVAHVNV